MNGQARRKQTLSSEDGNGTGQRSDVPYAPGPQIGLPAETGVRDVAGHETTTIPDLYDAQGDSSGQTGTPRLAGRYDYQIAAVSRRPGPDFDSFDAVTEERRPGLSNADTGEDEMSMSFIHSCSISSIRANVKSVESYFGESVL